MKKVAEHINQEINTGMDKMEKEFNNKILFAGYNSICSLGREMALPGSDADGMFIIVDDLKGYDNQALRVVVPYHANKRILGASSSFLPEVFSLEQIKDMLKVADESFKSLAKELKPSDYERFEDNITQYRGTDYVKAAEFNVRLAEHTPDMKDKADLCLLGMFVELVRSGKILRNNFDDETLKLIKKSPLYKYSNINRQEALKDRVKDKIRARRDIEKEWRWKFTDERFDFIRSLLYASYGFHDVNKKHKKYFMNDGNGFDVQTEMGNLLRMYQVLRGEAKA